MKNKCNFILVSWLLLVLSTPIFASSEATEGGYDSVVKVVIAITAFLVAFVIWLALVYSESNDLRGEKIIEPFKMFIHSLTQTVSLQEEDDIMLNHDFDGIKELDNKIPPWWKALFYGAIVFAFVYMIDYHVLGDGNVQENEYMQEVQAANIKMQLLTKSGKMISEETVAFVDDVASLSAGKDIFDKNCAACHGFGGEGLVGPNFTDDYWIHGGSIKNMYKIIAEGVPAKGMISWKSQLSPNQIQEVSSYIRTLYGTNPPNQKAPEGEKWDLSAEMTK